MTAAPLAAVCRARVPAHLSDLGHHCNADHFGNLHVCRLPGGAMFVWPDDTTDITDQWRGVTGEDLTAADAARVEAIGTAAITLQAHRWMGWNIDTEHDCSCGWQGDDHELHVAEQLWALGALDRHAGPAVAVVKAATEQVAYWKGMPGGTSRLRDEPKALIAAVDALGGRP